MTIAFSKAVKYAAKGRVALIGPAGSGKSFTALLLARTLAGPTGKIAAIDTEHGSLSKYADIFDFDVIELDSCSPQNFLAALKAAEDAGYAAFITDSLSHFWMGKDGALEFVDVAAKRSSSRDGMAGWKEFRPHERQMVDALIASPMHIVCTMRTKTAYEEHVNDKGKKVRVKIGLAPVQREGLEYEFDLVGLMDEDNTFIVDKSRCPELTGKALAKPGEKEFAVFRDWLSGAARATAPAAPVRPPAPAPAVPVSSAPAPAPRPAPAAPVSQAQESRLSGNLLHCLVVDVIDKTTANGRPYVSVTLAQPVDGKRFAACWHGSLLEALRTAKGKTCQFEVSITEKFVNIEAVLEIGGQEYRDGKPYNGKEEPARALAGMFTEQPKLEITDDDIPF